MNIFSSIEHFFEHLFGANSNEAQKVLGDVSHYVTLAEPIVVEVEDIIKAAPQSAVLAAIEKFLSKYEPDLAKVATTAASLAALPSADLWHNAAVLALQTLVPQAGVAASLLNLAVELAYNIFKQKQAATAQPPKAG